MTTDKDYGWEACDWSKPSLAVLAIGTVGEGCVLHTVGAHVACDIDQISSRLDELDFDPAPPADLGIVVWEGVTKGGGKDHYNGDYYDTYLRGKYREPTPEEWEAIKKGKCPWDPTRWYDPAKVKEIDEARQAAIDDPEGLKFHRIKDLP